MNTTIRPITQEDWDYFLGCMPPCKWGPVAGGEAFYLCELLDLNLAMWCVRLGDSYYRVHASPRLSAQQAADLVTAQSQPCLSS